MKLIHSIQSEWLKTRRSTASWLCLIGGFFIPLIYFILFLKDQSSINHVPSGNPWEMHFNQLWQNMSMFLLPMGVIMASSLITQIEYRNNSWKQLHTTPQNYATVFAAKLIVILLMMVKFFIFFNIGILISAIVPCLLFDGALPEQPIPITYFLKENACYFIACLPIVSVQFLISLQFKNFLVPFGIGFLLLVGTLIGLTWEHIYISPFSFAPLQTVKFNITQQSILLLACVHTILIIGVAYTMYIFKKEKG